MSPVSGEIVDGVAGIWTTTPVEMSPANPPLFPLRVFARTPKNKDIQNVEILNQ